MDAFRFAIMGAGNIARHFCDAVQLVPGCEVVAAASKSKARARHLADEKGLIGAYDSYSAMLDAEKPDCVYIATTCDAHYALAMLCAAHGIPVLCEKAMFMSSAEAERFFQAAEAGRIFAMEALWSRFLPAVNRARAWVLEGHIGEVSLGEMSIGFPAPPDPENRYFNPALGGGAAYDLTVYGLQILTWVLNRPIQSAQVQTAAAKSGVDASEIVLLNLGGIPAAVSSSLTAPMDERLVIYGTDGSIVVPHAHYGSEAILLGKDGRQLDRFVDDVTVNGFTYEIKEAMRCVRSGALESRVVPWDATRACARVYDQIRNSVCPA